MPTPMIAHERRPPWMTSSTTTPLNTDAHVTNAERVLRTISDSPELDTVGSSRRGPRRARRGTYGRRGTGSGPPPPPPPPAPPPPSPPPAPRAPLRAVAGAR